jgi:hypothetical protein
MITNKCKSKKCGCQDTMLTTPTPCPTPSGCPTPNPCGEVTNAQCVIYTGNILDCNGNVIVTPNNNIAEALNNIINYVCGNERAYKVYTALLSQSGTNDPSVEVLENNIGNIDWIRTASGVYEGTLTGAFVSGKTALFIQKNVSLCKILIAPKDLWIEYTSADTISIYTSDENFLIDNVLNNTTIEIRVYN